MSGYEDVSAAGETGHEAVAGALRHLAPRLDHVAVAARRLRDLLPLYTELLGGHPVTAGDNVELGFRAVVLEFSTGSRIELLEPLPGLSFLSGFLDRHPRGGVHHLTFRVDDLAGTVGELRAHGYTPFGVRVEDPVQRELFLHPREAHGTLVQLMEPRAEYPAPQRLRMADVLAGRVFRGTGVPSP